MRLGDESALESLYARYGGLVYTLALRIVGDPELAREVVQDTFLRSWDGRETYDARRGRVPWWLMGIARNRAIDLLRSRSHRASMREWMSTWPAAPRVRAVSPNTVGSLAYCRWPSPRSRRHPTCGTRSAPRPAGGGSGHGCGRRWEPGGFGPRRGSRPPSWRRGWSRGTCGCRVSSRGIRKGRRSRSSHAGPPDSSS